MSKWCEDRGQKYRDKADEYKEATDFPDRYSSFYPEVTDNYNSIIVILHFSHINRRHAMSPDGWALMQNDRFIYVRSMDLLGRKKG